MRRAFTSTLILTVMLTGCARNIADVPLEAYDLADREVVAEVLSELPKQQRGAFATFTVHHLATSKAFCGDVLVDSKGREPVTVGDAIRLTIAREEERNRKPPIIDPATLSPIVRHRLALNDELKARESLVDRREMLLMTGDGTAQEAGRLAELEKEITASAQRLAALRASAPPGA